MDSTILMYNWRKHNIKVGICHLLKYLQQKVAFWFATGGAGFCISKALGIAMVPEAGYEFSA